MYKQVVKWVMWSCIILGMSVFTVKKCSAQDNFAHHHGGRWHSHPHNQFHYHNGVSYYPIVQWFPHGTNLNVGPVLVSPDRRHIRMGINMNFSSITGFHTFNYRTGQSRWHPNK